MAPIGGTWPSPGLYMYKQSSILRLFSNIQISATQRNLNQTQPFEIISTIPPPPPPPTQNTQHVPQALTHLLLLLHHKKSSSSPVAHTCCTRARVKRSFTHIYTESGCCSAAAALVRGQFSCSRACRRASVTDTC